MAAPEYVPSPPVDDVRGYRAPETVPDGWAADRPSDLLVDGVGQPEGPGFGHQGPDAGYALTLVHRFDDRLVLRPGEDRHDVDAGCVAVAMKRASLFGRAPVIHDLEIAYRVWGYLDSAPDSLAELRAERFAGVGHAHHYTERRAIAEAVPEGTLRMTPPRVAAQHEASWRSLLDV